MEEEVIGLESLLWVRAEFGSTEPEADLHWIGTPVIQTPA